MKNLIICGHGQGKTGYDVGAVNRSLNITEAQKVRELASLMNQHATKTHFITDKNVYDFRDILYKRENIQFWTLRILF